MNKLNIMSNLKGKFKLTKNRIIAGALAFTFLTSGWAAFALEKLGEDMPSVLAYSDVGNIHDLPNNYAEIISWSNVQFDFWVEMMEKLCDDYTLDDENVKEVASAVDYYYKVFEEICDLGFEEGEIFSNPYGKNETGRATDRKGEKN